MKGGEACHSESGCFGGQFRRFIWEGLQGSRRFGHTPHPDPLPTPGERGCRRAAIAAPVIQAMGCVDKGESIDVGGLPGLVDKIIA